PHCPAWVPSPLRFPLTARRGQILSSDLGGAQARDSHPATPAGAMLGSDVLLPCSFTVGETISLPKFYLAWARGAEKVAEYLREKPTQQPKVKLFLEELSKGNCSLGLRIVRVEDEGRYTSTLIYTPDRSEQHLELQVTGEWRPTARKRPARSGGRGQKAGTLGVRRQKDGRSGGGASSVDAQGQKDGESLRCGTRAERRRMGSAEREGRERGAESGLRVEEAT
uniref:Ig-like domain-containing protein n=1 Tax=Chelonoidis abingdonii TaxID=106734 RepID=A0A8C0GJP4_CHEAB